MRRCLFVVLLPVALVMSEYTGEADATPSLSQVVRFIIYNPDDYERRHLTLSIGAEFVARSATFSDLLRHLRDASDLLLYVRFVQLPLPPSGRTRFEVAPSGLVVGFIEIDVGQPRSLSTMTNPLAPRGAIVAHELAHAFEVSCLPHLRTTEELLERLRARAASENRDNSIETPFATAVEKAVLDEWSSDARTASQLQALSVRYGLNALSCAGYRRPPSGPRG